MQRLLKVRYVHNGDLTNLAPRDNNSITQIANLEPADRGKFLESIMKGGRIKIEDVVNGVLPSNFLKQLLYIFCKMMTMS